MNELEIDRFTSLLGHAAGKQRARALDGLSAALPTLSAARVSALLPTLVAVAGGDGSDACRERAAALLRAALARAADRAEPLAPAAADAVADLAAARLPAEPTEEVRLALLGAVACAATRFGEGTLARRNDAVKAAVLAGAGDRFDDAKLAACALAEGYARHDPQRAFMFGDAVVPALAALFAHRKHGVRIAALAAVAAFVECGCVRHIEDVARQTVRLACDPSATIRGAVVAACRSWMLADPRMMECATMLLPALLTCVSDEIEEVRRSATAALFDVGERFIQLQPADQQASHQHQHQPCAPLPSYSHPFSERPPLGARLLVQKTLLQTLDWAFGNAVNVLDAVGGGGPLRSLVVLRNIAVLAETSILSALDPVLEFLCESALGKEPRELALVSDIAHIVGWFSGSDAFIPRMLPRVQDTGRSALLRTSACVVLHGLVSGCGRASLSPHLAKIVGLAGFLELSKPFPDQSSVALLGCVFDLLAEISPLCASDQELSLSLFIAVLDTTENENELASRKASETLEIIAPKLVNGCTSAAALVDHFFPTIATQVAMANESDKKLAIPRLHALVRGSKTALSSETTTEVVSKTIWNLASRTKEEMRLRVLQLALDMAAKISDGRQVATPEAAAVLVANVAWKPGQITPKIRATAATVLSRLLALSCPEHAAFLSPIIAAVPDIAAAMDDREPALRGALVAAMKRLVELQANASGDWLLALSAAFEARLDDTEDAIRIVAAEALSTILTCGHIDAAAPQLLRKLFVHLDDFNPSVQQAVFATLRNAAPAFPAAVLQLSEEMAPRHRSPHFCNGLADVARSKST